MVISHSSSHNGPIKNIGVEAYKVINLLYLRKLFIETYFEKKIRNLEGLPFENIDTCMNDTQKGLWTVRVSLHRNVTSIEYFMG